MHLVLDLDETLVSVSIRPIKEYDFMFALQGIQYYVKKRPGLALFLTFAFKKFKTVSVWTAATRDYAIIILEHIMNKSQLRKIIFFKTRCDLASESGNKYYKPLKKIFTDPIAIQLGINQDNTIMIDDRDDVLRDNPGNGIKIPPFKGDMRDKYLAKLLIILDGILHHNLGFGHFRHVMDLKSLVD